MIKNLTCIECPKGCSLFIDVKNGRVVDIKGHQCPKGEEYAVTEIENPVRILTSTVSAQGLSLKMVPVRTDKPIPKGRMSEAMAEIRKIKINRPLKTGDFVVKNLLGLKVNVITTRCLPRY